MITYRGGIPMRGKIITIGIIFILIISVFIPITMGYNNQNDEDLNSTVEFTYNIYGGTSQEQHLILTALEPPHANFTYSANGKNVFFDASTSYDNDGNLVSYDWDFGDGEIGSGKFVNYTYCCFDTYTVILNVTDNDGLTNETSKIITIFNNPPSLPTDPEPENNSIDIDITPLPYRMTLIFIQHLALR